MSDNEDFNFTGFRREKRQHIESDSENEEQSLDNEVSTKTKRRLKKKADMSELVDLNSENSSYIDDKVCAFYLMCPIPLLSFPLSRTLSTVWNKTLFPSDTLSSLQWKRR